MDHMKIGQLIRELRKENNLTQLQLAGQMNISDKAISKWERGLGCPDISLLPELSRIFSVDMEKLLSGELDTNRLLAGNMKKLHFYVCPNCGNIITSMAGTSVSCCASSIPNGICRYGFRYLPMENCSGTVPDTVYSIRMYSCSTASHSVILLSISLNLSTSS